MALVMIAAPLAIFAAVLMLGNLDNVKAASPSERDCIAAGGEFDRTEGSVSCVIETEENVGNSENSQTVETETDTTGRGNINNKQETEETCDGPGNSGGGSSHCR